MKAKAAIVTVFAIALAAAAVCGEQYRLDAEAAVDDGTPVAPMRIATNEVDVTN